MSPRTPSLRAAPAPVAALALALTLAGCTTVGPNYDRPAATRVENLPDTWQQPLPHGGSMGRLADWWKQFDDPLLVDLIAAAQKESASIASAGARIAQARASAVAADVANLPSLDGQASVSRGPLIIGPTAILRTQSQAVLQSSWEIDLFGGLARGREAARARLDARTADWHDARVSVAAEVANQYASYRGCEQLVALTEADVTSRGETARLTEQLAKAGFQSPANAALSRASAAESAGRLVAQKAECDLSVKALVALTGLAERDLRGRLEAKRAQLPVPAPLALMQVPAEVLAQRPDIAAAERDLAAASADIGVREADRYPRLSLSGNVGPVNFRTGNTSLNATTWSIGPTLSLPLFDAGRRSANIESAKVAYEAAAATYRERARRAVREVEEALVRLAAAQAREADAQTAVEGYRVSLTAAEQRWKSGLGSQIELEENRRLAVAADSTLATLRRDRVAAWIALYRAVGGGWDPADTSLAAAAGRPATTATAAGPARPAAQP